MRIFENYSHSKLVVSGSVLEKFDYSDAVGYGPYDDYYESGKIYKNNLKSTLNSQNYNLQLKKQRFSRLVDSNAYNYTKISQKQYPPVLMTLTYQENQQNLQKSKYDFNLFFFGRGFTFN